MEYEYGVAYGPHGLENLHRSNMTEDEARLWIEEVEADGFLAGEFFLIRRPKGQWQRVPSQPTERILQEDGA